MDPTIPDRGTVLPPSSVEQRRSPPTTFGRSASTAAATGTEHLLLWSFGFEVYPNFAWLTEMLRIDLN